MPAIAGTKNTAPKTFAARHPKPRGRPAGSPSRRTRITSAAAPIASGFGSGAWPIRITHAARRQSRPDALQDDIAETVRRLLNRGRDILRMVPICPDSSDHETKPILRAMIKELANNRPKTRA
jgi:hypothetical protein